MELILPETFWPFLALFSADSSMEVMKKLEIAGGDQCGSEKDGDEHEANSEVVGALHLCGLSVEFLFSDRLGWKDKDAFGIGDILERAGGQHQE